MDLQNKVLEAFNGKVVRKDLAFLVKGNLPVPTYVLEYLLGQYCATDDPVLIEDGIIRVKDIIRNNYINRAEAEEVKGRIRELGSYRVIDKITAILNDKRDFYEASFANLGLQHIPIGSDFVVNNPKLLSGNGVWCIVKINYLTGDDVPVRWEIETLKPIQISFVDVDEYTEIRNKFTTEEWLDFLIHTEGLNPDNLNRREKFIIISRLLPHVENNFNFMELGPKGTGKSHVFQELSPYGVLVSGGDVTSARLFAKISGNKEIMGLVGYWDVVAWDEFEQQPGKQVDPTMIDTMQNYLANKSFNRGKATHEASASMVFVGNTKHTVPYMLKNNHLFESIPHQFLKGAFLDRIHLYNPGWEMKMLKKSSFSAGFGLITDYIAAVLHELRNRDYSADMAKIVKFDGSLSERDHLAIRKTFSGMMKLLYPNGKCTEAEALEIIDFAAEGRKRVKEQLYIIDDTFRAEPAKFEYQVLRTGDTISIQTLEEMNFDGKFLHNTPEAAPAHLDKNVPAVSANVAAEGAKSSATSIGELMSSIKNVRLNQTGVSYNSLFGDYLKTAKHITVVDPFIRLPYQVSNLMEFVQCARQNSETPEELVIHLSTQNEDEKVPEMIDIFDDIKDDLAAHNIEFSYDFNADHDRYIKLDNGWTITLGRGLDIYEKVNKFSLDSMNQAERRCKEFNITYNKTDKV